MMVTIVEEAAVRRAGVLQPPVQADLVGHHDVELVDVEEPLGLDGLVVGEDDGSAALPRRALRQEVVGIELVLGAIKLRGKYSGLDMPPGADKFARHHGVSLLALALLGALVLRDGVVDKPAGKLSSKVLAAFHGGCVLVMLHAWQVL